jgi:hypothetical protein
MQIKDRENEYNCLELVQDTNICSKNTLVDIHKSDTANSLKTLENICEVPKSVRGLKETTNSDSPLQIQCSITNTSIYEMIWPQPKSILKLGHISPPFIVEKEFLISIIQVSIITYFKI